MKFGVHPLTLDPVPAQSPVTVLGIQRVAQTVQSRNSLNVVQYRRGMFPGAVRQVVEQDITQVFPPRPKR